MITSNLKGNTMNKSGQMILECAKRGNVDKFHALAGLRLKALKELREEGASDEIVFATAKPLVMARKYGNEFKVELP